MKALAILWQRHRLLLAAFFGTTVIALFFATRFVVSVIYWSDPAHRDQPLQAWMTIGYVSRSYDVPRDRLAEALGLAPLEKGKRPTLEGLARERGQPWDVFANDIKAAIARLRTEEATR